MTHGHNPHEDVHHHHHHHGGGLDGHKKVWPFAVQAVVLGMFSVRAFIT